MKRRGGGRIKRIEIREHDRRATQVPINTVVAPIQVDDPNYVKGRDDERDRHITVLRSLRDDPLARLHAYGRIDKAQYRAGRRMQGLYERASVGAVQAMDPMKEPVDGGGGLRDPLTDQVVEAASEIRVIEAVLGREGASLARDFLCSGHNVKTLAISRGVCEEDQRAMSSVGYRIREILETLAIEFGFVGK